MRIIRSHLAEKKDAISSFMGKEMPVSIASKVVGIYDIITNEIKTMEVHNFSQLAKYGTKNAEKGIYEMQQDNPNLQVFLKERHDFLSIALDAPEVAPIKISELESANVKLRPFELAELLKVGIIEKG